MINQYKSYNLFQSFGQPISISPRYHLPTKCRIQHHLGRHIFGMGACRHLNNNLPALEISSAWVSTSWAIGKTATETWNARAQSYPVWELATSLYKYPDCIVQIPIKPRWSFFLVVQTRPHFRKKTLETTNPGKKYRTSDNILRAWHLELRSTYLNANIF